MPIRHPVNPIAAPEPGEACLHPAESVTLATRQPCPSGGTPMRRIIIPLVFVALLTIAAVMPVVAQDSDPGDRQPKVGCDYSV